MTGGAQDSGAITRTMEREFWNGVPVVAYHWTIHDPECPIEGLRERPGIAYHWSTGPEDAARLISVADVEEYLSRATPAPAGWQEGEGWVFWNPDSGEEYAPNHPVESGECTDAESVRKSTPQEDTLYLAFQNEFARAEHLTDILREIDASAFDTYRARNNRQVSIEGDDGEKCSILPFSAMETLRTAIAGSRTFHTAPAEGGV